MIYNPTMQEPSDIVIVARDTWGTVWRRRQFLAMEFAARNMRVLFVEAPMSWPRLAAGSPDMAQRPRDRRWAFASHPLQVQENIWVTAPPKPFPNRPKRAARWNRTIFSSHVRRCIRSLDFSRPILWINPEYAYFLPVDVIHSVVVYDITDDWVHASSLPEFQALEIRDHDRRMTAAADIVFTVSHDLLLKKQNDHTNVVYMPNGVRPEIYEIDSAPLPGEMRALQKPVAGYTGSLHTDRLDVDLVEFISSNSDITQIFVGPDYLDDRARDRINNIRRVHLIAPQPLEKLPHFTAHFDVCHIPHLQNDFTHSLDPIKAYEYLATGRPVVSVTLRGLAHLQRYIDTAESYEEYVALLNNNINGRECCTREERRERARSDSWSARADMILEHIHNIL